MMNADQARKDTKEMLDKHVNKELKNVEALIIESALEAKYQATIGGTLREETKKVLKELGYEIAFAATPNHTVEVNDKIHKKGTKKIQRTL